MPSETKQQLVALILGKLREAFEARQAAAKQTREAGKDAVSKSEGKYDTRFHEENYLADSLAQQAQAAADAAAAHATVPPEELETDSNAHLAAPLDTGTLDSTAWICLVPAGGGTEIVFDERTISVLTPESPLGAKIVDRKAGDDIPGVKLLAVR